jgi:hypothetical protein
VKLADIFRRFSLESIVLNETAVKRGTGDPTEPSDMRNSGNFQPLEVADGKAPFLVGVRSELVDTEGQSILQVEASYLLTYRVDPAWTPSDEELRVFATQGVLFQVHPYLREFIASITSRAGLPPALLPVLVRDDLDDDDMAVEVQKSSPA